MHQLLAALSYFTPKEGFSPFGHKRDYRIVNYPNPWREIPVRRLRIRYSLTGMTGCFVRMSLGDKQKTTLLPKESPYPAAVQRETLSCRRAGGQGTGIGLNDVYARLLTLIELLNSHIRGNDGVGCWQQCHL